MACEPSTIEKLKAFYLSLVKMIRAVGNTLLGARYSIPAAVPVNSTSLQTRAMSANSAASATIFKSGHASIIHLYMVQRFLK